MSRIFRLFLLFILISACSLDKKSRIWSIDEKKDTNELVVEELFKEEKKYNEEKLIILIDLNLK